MTKQYLHPVLKEGWLNSNKVVQNELFFLTLYMFTTRTFPAWTRAMSTLTRIGKRKRRKEMLQVSC